MKRFKTRRAYLLLVSVLAVFSISGCNGHWDPSPAVGSDTTKPTVTATVPGNAELGVPINRKVTATFSEAMAPATIDNNDFTVVNTTLGGSRVSGTVTYSAAARTATFTPTTPATLPINTVFTATITTRATDLAGNPLAGNQGPFQAASNYIWTFTTGAVADNTAPTVILRFPDNAATGVVINSAVHATFSKDMDPSTINSANFSMRASSAPPLSPVLAGAVAYASQSRIATFTPAGPLAVNTQYTATVTTGVKDLAGNAMADNNVWTFTTGAASAPSGVNLRSAATFGIMATSAVTSTGNSVINGNVSLDPGTSMTGFPPAVVNGVIHINDSVSRQARADLLTAYNFTKALPSGTTITAGADLGALNAGGILPPGTYTSGSTMLVSTPLVLDAKGDANALWVFQIGSSLTTSANVTLLNGAQAKNVFWVPTLDATIGVGTIFHGTIISGRDVTAVTGATINGRILAGATTAGTIALQTSTINVPAP